MGPVSQNEMFDKVQMAECSTWWVTADGAKGDP